MAKKLSKLLRRRVKLHDLHNQLILLNRNEELEGSFEVRRLIVKALNTLRNYTDFSMIENIHSLALKHEFILDIVNETGAPGYYDTPGDVADDGLMEYQYQQHYRNDRNKGRRHNISPGDLSMKPLKQCDPHGDCACPEICCQEKSKQKLIKCKNERK